MSSEKQEHLLSLDTYDSWKKAFDKGRVKQTCQQCHMPTGGKDRPIALGGPVRSGSFIHRHFFHGGHNAVDASGKPLAHTGGRKKLLPPLAGMGKSPRDFGGHVGAMFARPFATKSGKAPTGGFNADHILFDTRIYPGQTAKRAFHFKRPASGHARVRVRLIYRWAFKPLVDKKGWKIDDIVIADKRLAT